MGNLGNEEMLFLASITKEMAATYETNHAEKGTRRSENFRSVYGAVGLRPLNLSPRRQRLKKYMVQCVGSASAENPSHRERG